MLHLKNPFKVENDFLVENEEEIPSRMMKKVELHQTTALDLNKLVFLSNKKQFRNNIKLGNKGKTHPLHKYFPDFMIYP